MNNQPMQNLLSSETEQQALITEVVEITLSQNIYQNCCSIVQYHLDE